MDTARRQPFKERRSAVWRWPLIAAVAATALLIIVLMAATEWEPEITMRTVPIYNVHVERAPAMCFDTYQDAAKYYEISDKEALRVPVRDECK